ncbi:MAG: hypothetical protein VXZ96_10270 [Myxococcota bacterium]|nr:hypothetical protein [Myxococcota bacterium]
MGAPTWPPTPEEALKQTRQEYGATQGQFLSPEDFEAEWLRVILSKPTFQTQSKGTELSEHIDFLRYWMGLNALEVLPIYPTEGHAAQDFDSYLLPGQIGMSSDDSKISWRIMLIIQSQVRQLGIHRNKPLLKELNDDWSLRQHMLLLIGALSHNETRRLWSQLHTPSNIAKLYLGQTEINSQDLPPEILAYVNYSVETPKQPLVSYVQNAINSVLSSPTITRLACLQNEAQKLKTWFRKKRYGIPPNPFVIGSIRPSWIDNALKVNRTVVDAWKAGPKPLRLLNKVLRRQKQPQVLTDLNPVATKSSSHCTLDEWNGSQWQKNCVSFKETDTLPKDNKRYLQIIEHRRNEAEILRDSLASLFTDQKRRHQSFKGEEIDLDAFVRARTQLAIGTTPRENWFIETIETQIMPKITVLIDATGSAHYRFQQAQQEALALLTFASIGLPLEWEVWSFAGESEGLINLRCFKRFSDRPTTLQTRLDSLTASGGSRLGAVLRWQSRRASSSNHLVLWFSDLIPEDGKSYALEHAELDLWMSIQELKSQQQLHCFDFAGRIEVEKAQRLLGKKQYTRPKRIDNFPGLFASVLLLYLTE